MALLEFDYRESKTSTGMTTRQECVNGREWTVWAETAAGSTSTFQLHTARSTESTCVAIPYGTLQNLGASSAVCLQFSGPSIIFARVTDLTSTGTISFRFMAN